jgi:16S rRNA (cytidine1402-2'-O)-methyltransferase
MQEITPGTLYVVATPIGNLADFPPRAVETLAQVELVVAEDTRHTAQLLRHFGLNRPMLSLHEHNEKQRVESIVDRLRRGESIALVSDAGTPLVSDPGFPLLRRLRELQLPVVAVPGPCAAIAALSVAGLPTDRFAFEGFLPPRRAARQARLEALATEPRTLVFYESGKRLSGMLGDLCLVFSEHREAAVARELTKLYESLYRGGLGELRQMALENQDMSRGELVVIVQGLAEQGGQQHRELDRVLGILLPAMPLSQATKLACALTGLGRNQVYKRATQLHKDIDPP